MTDEPCPYDFLTDFDGWFLYQKCVHYFGSSHSSAIAHVQAIKSGWVVCEGFKTGCYTLPPGEYAKLLDRHRLSTEELEKKTDLLKKAVTVREFNLTATKISESIAGAPKPVRFSKLQRLKEDNPAMHAVVKSILTEMKVL